MSDCNGFRPIPGYEGFYEVNAAGLVRSCTRTVKRGWNGSYTKVSQPIRIMRSANGYSVVPLSKDSVCKRHYVHRLVYAAFRGPAKEIDHIDRDRQNNSLSNLRPCTRSMNMGNSPKRPGSSRFKGVSMHKNSGKWTAQIKANSLKHHLGYFSDEESAAAAYRAAASRLFGEFARV